MLTVPARRILFAHMPKTGGTFIKEALKYLYPDSIEAHGLEHYPPPEEEARRLVLGEGYRLVGSIREPLSWYGSVWRGLRQQRPFDKRFRAWCEPGAQCSFRSFLEGVTHPGLGRHPEEPKVGIHANGVLSAEDWRSGGVGLWTHWVCFIFPWGLHEAIWTPDALEGLRSLIGPEEVERLPEELQQPRPTSQVMERPEDEADAEMRSWVEEADSLALEMDGIGERLVSFLESLPEGFVAYPACACGHRQDRHRDDSDPRGGGCWQCDCASYSPEGPEGPEG